MNSPNTDIKYLKPISRITARSSLYSLMYKSTKIQLKNYCSNICQVLTPLLCVLFTLVIQIITDDVVSGKVSVPDVPRPLDMPLFTELLPFNLSCREIYLYEFENGTAAGKEFAHDLMSMNLKRYCPETDALSPTFTYQSELDQHMM